MGTVVSKNRKIIALANSLLDSWSSLEMILDRSDTKKKKVLHNSGNVAMVADTIVGVGETML